MAFSLPTDRLGQTMMLAIILAFGGAYVYWTYAYGPKQAEIAVQGDSLALLESRIEGARRELQTGTAEDIRRRLETYEASLQLMRRLVPTGEEIPQLLDDLSTRAKIRGVNIVDYQPQPAQLFAPPADTAGGVPFPFQTYVYRFEVVGRYDQIGEFMADVASLSRVFVPEQLSLIEAADQYQQAYDDTTGALINATFMLRTFVKPGQAAGGGGETL